jgi:4-hydroxy-3-methylbut-2-en-1-yl diphosphate reductase
MRITVDKRSGFCTGVVKAVEKAEEKLGNGGELYSLGKIVHNTEEIGRLADRGLKTLTYDEFRDLKNSTVLIRAHGEPPQTFEIAKKNNIRLIDATCPVVQRLQQKIRDKHTELMDEGGLVLIFGKKDHPEVRALVGQTGGNAVVVRFPEELEGLQLKRPVALYSQTTMNQQEFEDFLGILRKQMQVQGGNPDNLLSVNNTICKQVSSRELHLRKFAREHDVVFFVSGRESSNGQALFKVCRESNPDSYFITNTDDLTGISLEGKETIGISGATSTPGWLIKDVEDYLRGKKGEPFT